MEKEKKKISKTTSASLFTILVIIVALGVTLPLHFIFPDVLTTYWVIAICVAVISPFALANFKINTESKNNFTEEQKKAASTKIGVAILSIWYADFAFICMFMNWLVAFFILAGLYLVKMVCDIASVLIKRKDSSSYPNFLIISDFVLSFLLSILLIYKIPDANLQTIVTAIVAALIGGLLTLLGVMLTIKKSDNDRREDELKKAKPLFTFNMLDKEPTGNAIKKLCVPEDLELEFKQEVYAELENSEKSSIKLTKLFHDGKWFELQGNKIMLPNKSCYFSFKYKSPLNIFLAVEDTFGQEYFYHVKVVFLYQMFASKRLFNTIRELNEISENEMNKLIKEEPKYE